MSSVTLPNSTYLDFTSWHAQPNLAAPPGGPSVEAAYNLDSRFVVTPSGNINVALILPRANDPTVLLDSNWATRQETLAELNANGTLWQTYGADQQQYNNLVSQLGQMNIPILGQSDGYVSSQESRTVWVSLDAANFQTLFGEPLLAYGVTPSNVEFMYWNGNLSLPSGLGVTELWIDNGNGPPSSPTLTLNTGAYTPTGGPQSIGNAATSPSSLYPQQVAADYHFPLSGNPAVTGTIGLIEPEVGSTLAPGTTQNFNALLAAYLAQAGVAGTPSLYTVAYGGQQYNSGSDERSLDIGVGAAINPYATFGFYAGSGTAGASQSGVFTAYQSAIWDTAANPHILSSSWNDGQWSAPGSPFYAAYQDLFIDAALRNIALFSAAGDGGSGDFLASGLDNLQYSNMSPFVVEVGGTSIVLAQAAPSDSTMSVLLTQAQALDPAVIWGLIKGGLTTLPTALAPTDPLFESVWNAYQVAGTHITPALSGDNAGSGGVDTREAIPGYQSAYGLNPTTDDPGGGTGRGVPDVAALAGGDTFYIAPIGTMETTSSGWRGTSAAAPLWASLALQVDTVFHDQGLPHLGYATDLFYIAAVVAPGSFNDILQGNNISTFHTGGIYDGGSGNEHVGLTGLGYSAGPGYDLVSGLGTPNGLLFARALSAIAHSEMSFGNSPPLLDDDGNGGWDSGAHQSLLFQTMSGQVSTVGLEVGSHGATYDSFASGSYAWTSQMAQQVMQADFDPNLVRLFDKQAQGVLTQAQAGTGDDVSVAINGQAGDAFQASLSNPFGFADFFTASADVRVARPVAVAETAGGQNDQIAIVRVRQDGTDSDSVSFYKVDSLTGDIGNLHPGDPGYAAAAQARAYNLTSGGTSVGGPGYGNFTQTGLAHVNAGDLVAMKLTDASTGNTYWGFAQANETGPDGQHVGHLWNYGLNTWGFEDQYGGGDHDFNDLVVQLDFTSASGHGWLV
jgi:Domain of unknown function (DUF4114)